MEIKKHAERFSNFRFYFTDIEELDITSEQQVNDYLVANQIKGIINCAAYTAVDKAEDEPELATLINKQGPQILATFAHRYAIRLIHISTDYVFDGEKNMPYTENDLAMPTGVYGQTKLDGEKAVLNTCPEAVITRTSWLYSSSGNNFVKTMLRLMNKRKSIGVVADQVGTPTYATDLAWACLNIIKDENFQQKAGIYHFSNEGVASLYDFAIAIRELSGLPCIVRPLETSEYPTITKRPAYSILNKTKIKQSFGLEIPYWRDSLETCLKSLL